MNILRNFTLTCCAIALCTSTVVAQQPTDFTKAAESTINGVVSIKCYATPRSYSYGGYDPFNDPFFDYFFGERRQQRQQPKQQEQQQQQNSEEMSQETAEQILEAFSQDEKQLQEEMQRRKGGQRSLEKDW